MSITVLRLLYGGGNTTSPAVLRFIGEPPPPVLIPDGDIGINTDLTWVVDQSVLEVSDEIVVGTLSRIGQWVDLMMYSPVSVKANIELPWVKPPVVEIYFVTGFDNVLENEGIELDIGWGISARLTQHTDFVWAVSPSVDNQLDIDWTNNLSILESISDADFITSVSFAQQTDIFWHSGTLARWANPDIVWGPHRGRLICSSDAPLVKGIATLRLSDLAESHTPGAIVLRFTPSPQFCYWDDGGGPIDNTPDLPNIDFNIPIEPQIRRVYLMQPTLSVIRLSDSLPIVVTGVSIGSGRGAFTKTGTIDFASRGDCDRAMNQLLLITINGYDFYAIPEEKSHRQSFNSTEYSATFRSKTAEISEPWKLPISYSNSTDRSLAGIMGDILQDTGWTVELVGFTDFNVPAKVFSVAGKGPIESVNEMADMIGCMIVEDELDNNLKIVPYWPTTPWSIASATPAVNIHQAVIYSYSTSDEINEQCDTCWVRAEQQGVSRQVKLTGTAGNIPTNDVSNKLIVTDTPARLAGTRAIADTGHKEKVSVTIPIMVDLPPLVKGMVIGVSYFDHIYKAMCDSVSISATVNDSGVDVVQSVVLIRPTGV